MRYKVKDMDYFKKKDDKAVHKASRKPVQSVPVEIEGRIKSVMKKMKQIFTVADLPMLQKELGRIEKDMRKNYFSIGVVGEFSKGKSSFINMLLEKEILPVGDLPVTAMMTRIRYNSEEVLAVFDENGKHKETLPLTEDSWEGLIAEDFSGEDPKGILLAGVRNRWLKENNIEFIDTPGAGDLKAEREKVIGDALVGCDGVIITVAASAALSMSEKFFIEERVITRKTPFLMLVITKMDRVPIKQRIGIIEYIRKKLASWNMQIPVYVPYPVEMPDDLYEDLIGIDKVKFQLEKWAVDPERIRLTQKWLATRLLSLVDTAISVLSEQDALQKASDKKEREKLIAEKENRLSEAEVEWERLRCQLTERSEQCYGLFLDKMEEYETEIIERMQHDISHTNNPEKWWKEDYPYKVKNELTNMMVKINNIVLNQVGSDMQWFNLSMDKNFKTHVLCKKSAIADKEALKDISLGDDQVATEDIQKKRALVRAGTAAMTVAGAMLVMSVGGYPLIATTGIGTGVSLLSDDFFRKKLEKQREMLKEVVGKNIPVLIEETMQESEGRLKAIYEDALRESVKSEETWLKAQKAAIGRSVVIKGSEQKKQVSSCLAQLGQIRNALCGQPGRS